MTFAQHAWAQACDTSCAVDQQDRNGCCRAKPPSSVAQAPNTVASIVEVGARVEVDWRSQTLGDFKAIPAGTYRMGSTAMGGSDPRPEVTLTRGFWLMESEVTQGMWAAVMGTNPRTVDPCGSSCPVRDVSWEEVQDFVAKASARDGVQYRLPTEAEWEWAARGGEEHEYSGAADVGAVAWYDDNSGGTPHPVCEKQRNGFGLCDMSGNAWEWVSDRFGRYDAGTVVDPIGAAAGTDRVFRGGGWDNLGLMTRVWLRSKLAQFERYAPVGFRLARSHQGP